MSTAFWRTPAALAPSFTSVSEESITTVRESTPSWRRDDHDSDPRGRAARPRGRDNAPILARAGLRTRDRHLRDRQATRRYSPREVRGDLLERPCRGSSLDLPVAPTRLSGRGRLPGEGAAGAQAPTHGQERGFDDRGGLRTPQGGPLGRGRLPLSRRWEHYVFQLSS